MSHALPQNAVPRGYQVPRIEHWHHMREAAQLQLLYQAGKPNATLCGRKALLRGQP
jgi:hypothetical protein